MIILLLGSCGASKRVQKTESPDLTGMDGLEEKCLGSDTIHSILIKKSEAMLTYDQERYEVSLTLYSKRDSIIYLSLSKD